jgi:hypothetical protein
MENLKLGAACAVLILAVAALSGCAASPEGPGPESGVAHWDEGSLRIVLAHPVRQVYDATMAALHNISVGIVADKTEAFNGEIESALRSGSDVRVNLKLISPSQTELTIRIGLFGDRDQSDQVLAAIQSRLPAAP